MIRNRALSLALLCTLASPMGAVELALPPNAQLMLERNSVLDSYAAPFSPYENGAIQTRLVEGQVRRSAWRIASPGLTTLQILEPLRAQVLAAGYDVVLDCDQLTCGGFDFRFGTEVLPAPSMYVNIRAFRFLLAIKGAPDTPDEIVGLMVSASETASNVQIIQAGQLSDSNTSVDTSGNLPVGAALPTNPQQSSDLLLVKGSIVLEGLDFATGTSDLGVGPFISLGSLAKFLNERDDVRVALVGHTDSVGTLSNNIALSKKRAASVRARLIEAYGVSADRLDAEGMGYLAPVASNLEKTGREANRRVEAVVLPMP